MTSHRPVALLLLATLLLPLHLHGQEPEAPSPHSWIISAGGGYSIPITPDYFAGQWRNGSIITGSLEYLLISSVSVGAAVTRSHFRHTGKSLVYRDTPFSCIGGGDRSFTTTEVRMRFYLLEENSPLRISLIAGLGATTIFRDEVRYYRLGFTLSLPDISSTHVAMTIAAGIELPLLDDLALAVEGGYGIVEDGVWVNHVVPLTATMRLRL